MQNMWVSDCYQCQVNFFQLYHCISWLEKVYEEMICIREKTLPSWTCIIIAPWNYWYRCAALFIMLYRKQANKSLFLLLIILRSSKYSLWFDTMSIMDQTNKFLHSSRGWSQTVALITWWTIIIIWHCVQNIFYILKWDFFTGSNYNKIWIVDHKHSTIKPMHVVTCIKRSPFSCPVIENFIWIEPLLRGLLSYKATFFVPNVTL